MEFVVIIILMIITIIIIKYFAFRTRKPEIEPIDQFAKRGFEMFKIHEELREKKSRIHDISYKKNLDLQIKAAKAVGIESFEKSLEVYPNKGKHPTNCN